MEQNTKKMRFRQPSPQRGDILLTPYKRSAVRGTGCRMRLSAARAADSPSM